MIFAARIATLKLTKFVVLAGLMLLPGTAAAIPARAEASLAPLVVYQIQTGAQTSVLQEYISLYNNTAEPVDITNWCVVYSSSSDITQTQLGCLKSADPGSHIFVKPYSAWLMATTEFSHAHPEFTADMTFSAGLASASGHIKLLNAAKQIIDAAGWGLAVHPEGIAAGPPATGKILQRHGLMGEQLQDTNNNAADFSSANLVLPASGNLYEEINTVICSNTDTGCTGFPAAGSNLILSEILPDAAGADAGQEFIELYNPTDMPLSTAGYALQLGPEFTKSYKLPDIVIEPKSYRIFTDTETGLTLPNTSAAVRLAATDGTPASETTYNDTEENTSFAYVDGNWVKTYQPTPGSANIYAAVKPCPESQVRNLESGQCRQAVLPAGIAICKEGQIRNIETGRCRNAANALATAAACKIGQKKNPATNRCVNIPAAAAAKTCPAGQERNPQTGRCKKITALAASGTNSVTDVPAPLFGNNKTWWIIGAAVLGTTGYALFEWRQELFGLTVSLKNKLVAG